MVYGNYNYASQLWRLRQREMRMRCLAMVMMTTMMRILTFDLDTSDRADGSRDWQRPSTVGDNCSDVGSNCTVGWSLLGTL